MQPADFPDHVDRLRDQWRRELPGVDTTHMAIFGRILRVARLIDRPIDAVMARHGIDRGEFDVLAALRRAGGAYTLTPTQLYRSLMISSGGVTHRLKRLARAGLIARRPAAGDGRSQLVTLTAKGRATVEATLAEDSRFERRLLSALAPAELEQLEIQLRRLGHAVAAGLEAQDGI